MRAGGGFVELTSPLMNLRLEFGVAAGTTGTKSGRDLLSKIGVKYHARFPFGIYIQSGASCRRHSLGGTTMAIAI